MVKPAKLIDGRTGVVLIIDMKHFVVPENHDLFETLRCTKDFGNALCNNWPEAIDTWQKKLTSESYYEFKLTSDYVGKPVELITPAYQFVSNSGLNLKKLDGREHLILEKVMLNWEIHIRPTYTGFFVVYFSNKHLQKKVAITKLAKDVEDLLSITSQMDNEIATQISVCQFLGVEVVNKFIQSVGFKLHTASHHNVLVMTSVNIDSQIKHSNPYVIYTFDDIDSASFPERKGWSRLSREHKLHELLKILPVLDNYYNPKRLENVTIEYNFAGNLGCCILSSQAILIANTQQKYRKYQSDPRISNSSADLPLYSKAVEGTILAVLEIKELAAKVETFSFYLTESFTDEINNTRSMLFSGDIKLPTHIPTLIEHVSKMRFLFLLCKKLYRTSSWIVSEPIWQTADHLFKLLDMPTILENIDHNLNATSDITSHVDNLYTADLSESSNDLAYLGILLASTPLLLSIISLPSFWVDIRQLFITFLPQLPQSLANDIMTALNLFAWAGTIAVTLVTVFSLYLLFAIRKRLSKSIFMFLSSNRW